MPFRVVVDRDLCQGHGVCESEAPEVFSLPKGAHQVVVLHDVVADEHRGAVHEAVKYCPTHALSIEEIS